MRSYQLLSTFLLTAICLDGFATPAAAAHRQVFLLGGQSNMVGGGSPQSPLSQPYQALPDVRFYWSDPATTSTSPLPRNEWVDLAAGSGTNSGYGPELTFGHTLHQMDPDGNYALIKFARGGSNVSADWNPTVQDNVYEGFRTTVEEGLQKLTDMGDTYEIVGMLWTQGIRDGKDGSSSSAFQTNLERLIADVRLRYQPDLPFFISRLSINMTSAGLPGPTGGRDHDIGGLARIRIGQESVVANDPLAFMIDTDDFGTDPTHFNTSGLIDLGIAFAESYFANVVVPEPSASSLCVLATFVVIFGRRRLA